MTRVKRGTIANKRRKSTLKQTKGFKWGRKSKYRLAKDALRHAFAHSYNDRKKKKGEFRRLWQIKINAGARANGITYSQFVNQLKKNKIELDRKTLANLAEKRPESFSQIVEKTKNA